MSEEQSMGKLSKMIQQLADKDPQKAAEAFQKTSSLIAEELTDHIMDKYQGEAMLAYAAVGQLAAAMILGGKDKQGEMLRRSFYSVNGDKNDEVYHIAKGKDSELENT